MFVCGGKEQGVHVVHTMRSLQLITTCDKQTGVFKPTCYLVIFTGEFVS